MADITLHVEEKDDHTWTAQDPVDHTWHDGPTEWDAIKPMVDRRVQLPGQAQAARIIGQREADDDE